VPISWVAYWIEGVLGYFDAWAKTQHPTTPRTRSHARGAQEYDPELYALVNVTMAYDGQCGLALPALARV